MRVLVACEHSGVVREAFRRLGHDAWSCDLLPADDGSPYHFQIDIFDLINRERFDLMIGHPPCTDLAVSGARYFAEKRADGRQQKAIDFFMKLANADIPRICIENPVSVMSTEWRKPDQIIQPWMFGHDASKTTCLWLKNLPLLKHGEIIPPRHCRVSTKRESSFKRNGYFFEALPILTEDGLRFIQQPLWANQTPSGQNKLGPSEDRWKKRSQTYEGVARQMSIQWGAL